MDFLAHHDPRIVALGTQAEQQFSADSNVTLYKLRQFCEALAKRAAAKVGCFSTRVRSCDGSSTRFLIAVLSAPPSVISSISCA